MIHSCTCGPKGKLGLDNSPEFKAFVVTGFMAVVNFLMTQDNRVQGEAEQLRRSRGSRAVERPARKGRGMRPRIFGLFARHTPIMIDLRMKMCFYKFETDGLG